MKAEHRELLLTAFGVEGLEVARACFTEAELEQMAVEALDLGRKRVRQMIEQSCFTAHQVVTQDLNPTGAIRPEDLDQFASVAGEEFERLRAEMGEETRGER